MKAQMKWIAAAQIAATGVLILLCGSASAQEAVANFYKGKSINLYIGFGAGGGYDTYARTVARFMGKHIPGDPTIIPRQMTGAGSLTAANFVYNQAPKDGTVLATANQTLPLNQIVGDPGVKFNAEKFAWIGNPNADVNIVLTWRKSGIKTIEDAKTREVLVGATGTPPTASALYPDLMNKVLGAKFKVILGYRGTADMDLAMERGELDGLGSDAWATVKATKPDWLRKHEINILVQIGLKRAKDLPNVPLLMDLAKNDADRTLLKILSASTTVGRPLFAPPGTPPDRVKALRRAFDETMTDPKFIAEARRMRLNLNPVSGEELDQIVKEMVEAPKPIVARLQAIVGARN